MNNKDDFKELWSKQESSLIPDTKDIIDKASQFKKKKLFELYVMNILLALTSIFIIWIWYYYQPEMITTKIGIVLTIVAMFSYLVVYNKIFPLLKQVDSQINSSQYLNQLLKLKEKQLFLQKTMLSLYFALLSTGLGLYMIEYATRMTFIWACFTYGITFTWIAFNWFYLRPRSMKKQQRKINELINKFENLHKQFQSNE
ncbi:MAG: hypothetical protein JKX95_08900 [Bacteroidia bacterium]|nr:hypothetical protein [Bacteroidia bacterium]